MITSMISFLYYEDFPKARAFFEKVLQLKEVMDQGFAVIYQTKEKSFIGIVKKEQGSIDSSIKGGVLLSFNVDHIETYFEKIKQQDVTITSDIIFHKNIPLKSFFFTDHEGYLFEIQEFTIDEIKNQF